MSKHDPALVKQRSLTPEGELPEGLASYGHPVPSFRKASALRHYRDMNPDISTEQATLDIDKLSNFIERDQPYEAEAYWRQEMDGAGYQSNPRRDLDLCGYYRLLACLMTGGSLPKAMSEEEKSEREQLAALKAKYPDAS